LLNDLDAPAGVVHQMLGDERLAQSLDAGFFNETLAGVAL
jgi:hypothetical protein